MFQLLTPDSVFITRLSHNFTIISNIDLFYKQNDTYRCHAVNFNPRFYHNNNLKTIISKTSFSILLGT